MVCNNLAARGIDTMCAKHVIQLDYPKNPIDYALRVGRVGRLGQDGVVTNFIKKTDRELFNQI
jgi:superfamily II DNA/RNA helicase